MKKITLIGIALIANFAMLFGQTTSNYAGIADLNLNNENFTTNQNTGLKEAFLNKPEGITVDTNGRVYLTHWHRIMIIDGNNLRGRAGGAGDPTFSSGDNLLTGINGRFSQPRGIAVDPNTNEVYICDYDNNKIRKLSQFVNVTNAQINTAVAGTGAAGGADGTKANATFNTPYDILVMKNGDIIISEEDNNTIRKISGNNVTTIAGSVGVSGDVDATGSAARFTYPMGMCKMDENNILIADYNNKKIKKLNLTNFAVTTVVTGLNGPRDVEYVNGVIYITDSRELKKYENSTLTKWMGSNSSPDSTFGTFAQTKFGDLRNLTYNKKENCFYVVDYTYGIIKRIVLDATPVVDFIGNPLNPTVSQVVTLTDMTTNRSGTKQWTITPNNYNLVGGTTLNDDVVRLEFTQTGSYTVKLKYTYGTGTVENEKLGYISVSNINAKPNVDFDADKKKVATNVNVNLLDLSSNTPTSWSWEITPSTGVTFKNSTTSTSKFPIVSFANEGKYQIKLTATNGFGSDFVTKVDFIDVNNSFVNMENLQNTFSIYPNPSNSVINLTSLNNFKPQIYKIYNINGQEIETKQYNGNDVDISGLSIGNYSLILIDENGAIKTSKFMKN